jgi:hypothetical protein
VICEERLPGNYRGAFLFTFAPHQSTVVKQQISAHEKEDNPI